MSSVHTNSDVWMGPCIAELLEQGDSFRGFLRTVLRKLIQGLMEEILFKLKESNPNLVVHRLPQFETMSSSMYQSRAKYGRSHEAC